MLLSIVCLLCKLLHNTIVLFYTSAHLNLDRYFCLLSNSVVINSRILNILYLFKYADLYFLTLLQSPLHTRPRNKMCLVQQARPSLIYNHQICLYLVPTLELA